MKSKDWQLVGMVVVVVAVITFAIATLLFGGKNTKVLKVEVVSPISSDFPLPNTKYFNEDSLNPTLEIKIGEDGNTTPFNEQ